MQFVQSVSGQSVTVTDGRLVVCGSMDCCGSTDVIPTEEAEGIPYMSPDNNIAG